ncbi:hypothetical protein COV04_04175 [Candidatus Uhrbacteria bacterium CG10_big_fil_rev_8_21_14_0_10_48_11]|uniref:Uncharacterized protein n=1 Tax=Candidatus Uhrbacteria bacterium CG10_big_fil_rev_8_21_14_0_10_48_11 TaxID=1975037 RepID=A0A2M8LDS1_9BACT|nr:MAG: hypothetical protein COV04_04175 [Candidatus Uhrbacteria bacterium CG10_big_fil_rev_8_21_14_0_10_48_11]
MELGPVNNLKEVGHLCTIFLHRLNKPKSDSAYYSWNVIIDKTVRIFFELHKVWLLKFLNVEHAIDEVDQNFYKLYKKIYLAHPTERVKLTEKLVHYLIEKLNLPQTGEIFFPKDG